jgi:hypothetical protein
MQNVICLKKMWLRVGAENEILNTFNNKVYPQYNRYINVSFC